ncbi:MAG: thioesterase family protein [Lachnospiraceae bacterium]|nr:thioesterase family protein [Lachnospiraceae bacterium]
MKSNIINNKWFYEREVQYYETDQMKIVHHSNYIRWFEEARLSYMKDILIPYEELEEKGIFIPVLTAFAEYRKVFRYGDAFRIKLSIVKFNGLKMTIKYEVYDKITGDINTTGETSHCFLNRKWKPFNFKKEFPEVYDKFLKEINNNI